jgi:hypothetical protein
LANEIKAAAHCAKGAGGNLYVFGDGVYAPRGEVFVRQRVKANMTARRVDDEWSLRLASEVEEYIAVDCPNCENALHSPASLA